MKENLTFSFIGGDLRQLRVISLLSDEGFHIRIFGFGEESYEIADKVYISNSISDCLSETDFVVLPLPYSMDKVTINAPLTGINISVDEVVEKADESVTFFVGKSDDELERRCSLKNINVYDYAKREELAVMNAVPTAEGALETAMANTPFAIKDSKCMVVGYGKIGKILSRYLNALGAEVTATSRSKAVLAEIDAAGYKAVLTGEIKKVMSDFDIIFNTVPDMVLGAAALASTKKDVLIIDLASRPGGVDFAEAKRMNRRVIWALSLPGKVAPYSAGKIIKDTLMNMLEELEV